MSVALYIPYRRGRGYHQYACVVLCPWLYTFHTVGVGVTTNTTLLSCVRGYTHSIRSWLPPIRLCCPVSVAIHNPYGRGYHQYDCVVLCPWLYTFHTVGVTTNTPMLSCVRGFIHSIRSGLPPIRLCCPVSVAIHIPYGRGYHQYDCVVLCPWLYTFHTVGVTTNTPVLSCVRGFTHSTRSGLPPIRLCCPVSVAIHIPHGRGYHQYDCVVLCPWLYTFHTVGVTTNMPVLSCVRGYTHSTRSGYHQYACVVLCPWLYTFHTVVVTTNTTVLSCVPGFTHSIRSGLPPICLCCPVSVAIHIPHGRVTINTPVLSCVRGFIHSTRSVTTNTPVWSCVRGFTHSIRSGLPPIRLCCPVSVALHIPYGRGRGYHQYACVVLCPWLYTFHTVGVGVTTNTPVLSCVRGFTHSIRSWLPSIRLCCPVSVALHIPHGRLPPIRLCCPVSVSLHIPYGRGYHQYACVVLCPCLYTFHTVGVTTNTRVLSCVRVFTHSIRSGLPSIRLCCPVSVAIHIPYGRGYHQYACAVLCPWLYTFHTVGVTTNTTVLSCVRGYTHSIRSGLTPIRLCCPVSVAIHIPYGRGYHQYACVVLCPWLYTFHTVGYHQYACVVLCPWLYTASLLHVPLSSPLPSVPLNLSQHSPLVPCSPSVLQTNLHLGNGLSKYTAVTLIPTTCP